MKKALGLLLLMVFVLCACTAEDQFSYDGEPDVTNPEFERDPPPVEMPEYVGANQQANDDGTRSGLIDISNASKGYFAAQITAPMQCKVRITVGDNRNNPEQDTYVLDNDGTISFYPITRGSNLYTFTLFTYLGETDMGPSYEPFITFSAQVDLEDEFGPFEVPTRLVRYTPDSACVKRSHEVTAHAATELEVIQQIYYWISTNIEYDTGKADALRGKNLDYEPDPDTTLREGKGICYDYASLAAAMLRANGIPTKLIKGDVLQPGGTGYVYHAWNLIWTEEAGYIAVELPTKPGDWARIDTTFAAAGARDIGAFIGDGEHYTEISQH